MSPQFNQEQQVFCLNQIANSASSIVASQQDLQDYAACVVNGALADSEIQSMIGTWNTVWGPVIYQAPNSHVSDNAMFVAQKAGTTEFVVAIAGTNPISAYGWLVEDFTISPPQDWPYATGQDMKISFGTFTGINILLGMKSNGQSLNDYLASVVSDNASPNIMFTGHSLGGALSPTLALAFRDQQGQAGKWDPNSKATVGALFTAGPTPGNDAFSAHFTSQLQSTSTRVWNSIDMVPHAWQVDQLEEIPTFYVPNIEPNAAILAVKDVAVANSEIASALGSVMTELLPDIEPFTGTYNPDLPSIGELIEIKVADKLIDVVGQKLGWPKWEINLAKTIVKKIILGGKGENLEEQVQLAASQHMSANAFSEKQAKSIVGDIAGLLNFMLQAAYQHVGAYPIQMGTKSFNDRVTVVSKKCPVPS